MRGLFVGLTTIDVQYFIDEFPVSNVKIKSKPPDILVGGPATNAAVAFGHLNGGAHLATAIGDNSFSSFIHNDFMSNNIQYTDFADGEKMSPVLASVVTSLNGDRNIFTHNPADIKPIFNVADLFANVKPQVLLVDGFYPEFSISCAKYARKNNIPVVTDCGSWKPQYQEILKYCDVAICSADFFPPNCKNQQQVFTYLNNTGVTHSAISRGNESIIYQSINNRGEVNVKTTKVKDTLGAGDFLHGAFCYFWLKENDFALALKCASEVASFSCRFRGTREWLKDHNSLSF